MSRAEMAAMVAAVPALYVAWRVIVVARQDHHGAGLTAVVLLVTAGVVWLVAFVAVFVLLEAWAA